MSLSGSTLTTGRESSANSEVGSLATSSKAREDDSNTQFRYTLHYPFPPFFVLQPNLGTRAAQLEEWRDLIVSYCAYHHTFRFTPSHPLFHNTTIKKKLQLNEARTVLQYIVDQGRAEWIAPLNNKDANKEEAWIWWKSPEEWAQCIGDWVQETGQRNTVLTFYELLEGDTTTKREFHGLPIDMARRAIGVLVKRGKATVFGEGEGLGVKFFF